MGTKFHVNAPHLKGTHTFTVNRVNGLLKTKICRQQSTQLTKARRHKEKAQVQSQRWCLIRTKREWGWEGGWQNPPIIALQFWHTHRRHCWVNFYLWFFAHSLYFNSWAQEISRKYHIHHSHQGVVKSSTRRGCFVWRVCSGTRLMVFVRFQMSIFCNFFLLHNSTDHNCFINLKFKMTNKVLVTLLLLTFFCMCNCASANGDNGSQLNLHNVLQKHAKRGQRL